MGYIKFLVNLFMVYLFVSCSLGAANSNSRLKKVSHDDSLHSSTSDSLLSSDKVMITDFQTFAESIEDLKVGYSVVSNQSYKYLDVKSKYIPDGASLLGRVSSVLEKYFIVYVYPGDIRVPVLEVYDKKGGKLQDFQLIDYGYCTDIADENKLCSFTILDNGRIERKSFRLINNQENVEAIDTLFLW